MPKGLQGRKNQDPVVWKQINTYPQLKVTKGLHLTLI